MEENESCCCRCSSLHSHLQVRNKENVEGFHGKESEERGLGIREREEKGLGD